MTDEELGKLAKALAKELKNGNGNGTLLKYIGIPVVIGWIVTSVWWAASTTSDVKHQIAMQEMYSNRILLLESRIIVNEKAIAKYDASKGE